MNRGTVINAAVATACQADWEKMAGGETVRFCSHCSQNVYHLSALTAEEANKLILEKEGKLCVRFFRRPDGSVVTKDCVPVWQKSQSSLRRRVAALFSSGEKTATVINGRVLDAEGRPLPGAAVSISNKSGRVTTAVAQEEGKYRSAPLAQGEYVIQTEAQGFVTQKQNVSLHGQAGEYLETSLEIREWEMGLYLPLPPGAMK